MVKREDGEQHGKGPGSGEAACTPAHEGDLCKEGRDEENLIGRKEARFQRGLNPSQRSLGFIQ